MTAKELLVPRFEVIEVYPNSKIKIGDLLSPINNKNIHYDCFENERSQLISNPEKYPHLFKKLNWWEKRDIEDMPKKLKSLSRKDNIDFDLNKEEVSIILKWDMKTFDGFVNIEKRQVCSLTSWNPEYGYIPVD